MPDTYRINDKNGIIEIKSYGILTKQDMEITIGKALLTKKTIGIDKLIIDTSELKAVPSTTEIFDVMSKISRELTIALIVTKDQPTAAGVQFGETVAANRGGSVKIFSDKKSALAWLQGKK